jgi:hypothetical protein
MLRRRVRSALLIDFDNLISKFGNPLCDRVENWLNWLEDGCFDPGGPKREFLLKRVYWFTDNDANRPFFAKHGIDVSVTRAVKNKEKASSADFDITIDAVEMSYKIKRLDEVIILSFDSDFLTVLNHLQVKDISVGGMAFGQDRPAKAFRRLVDHVIEKEEFDIAMRYVRPKRGMFGTTIEQEQEALPERKAKAAKPKAAVPAPRAAAPAKAPAPKQAAPRQRAARPVFDLEKAATRCAEAAQSAPSAYLSKRFVTRALEGFEGFGVTGAYPWLGCGSYEQMIERFAKINPKLSVGRVASGALALIYRGGASEAA